MNNLDDIKSIFILKVNYSFNRLYTNSEIFIDYL